MSHITVYTKPACPQCNATKKHLDKNHIEYETIDISQDAEAREFVIGLGYMSAPVVVAGDDHFFGFRPDRLNEMAKLAAVA